MSRLFKRLPGFQLTPPGREREILRRLPQVLCWGSVLLMLPALASHLDSALGVAGHPGLSMTDIYVASVLILFWTIGLTVGLAAFIVMVMKGPAYVADAYPLREQEGVGRDAGGFTRA